MSRKEKKEKLERSRKLLKQLRFMIKQEMPWGEIQDLLKVMNVQRAASTNMPVRQVIATTADKFEVGGITILIHDGVVCHA